MERSHGAGPLASFSGYCFARFLWQERPRVLTAQGVVEVLGANGRGVAVPDNDIEAIQRLVSSTLAVDPHHFLEPGMAVEVRRGPLEGVRGVLIRKGLRMRLIIAVTLIRQGGSVQIDADDMVPV